MFLTRNVMMKYRRPAGDGGDGGGSGGSDDAAKKAAEAKAAADAEAAQKAAAEDAAKKAAEDAAKGGKPGPTDEEAKLLKEVMEKKTKLKAVEDEKAALAAKLKEFDGIDPVAIRALLNEKKVADEKALEEKGEWGRLKAQMNEEHAKQLNQAAAIATAAQEEVAKLKGVIAELTVGNSFSGSPFIKEDLTMPPTKVRVIYGSHFEFQDGKIVGFDKPAGATERTMLVDAKGDALNFDDALKKIVDGDPDREQILKSKMKPGASSKTVPKPGTPAQKFDEVRGAAKISEALSKGAMSKK